MTTLLAGDIGGTKTLLSLYRCEGELLQPLAVKRYPSADWDALAPIALHFLATTEAAGHPLPAAACLAVAGPVRAGCSRLTNLPWRLDAAALAADLGILRLELVNDFAVLIYGLPHVPPAGSDEVRPGSADPGEPLLVLGAGTGLGVALGVPVAGGLQAVASEAAHGEFAPRSEAEWQLREWLRADLGLERLSIERVVSGTGLGHVARWLLAVDPGGAAHPLAPEAERWRAQSEGTGPEEGPRADLPAAVAAAAAQGDRLARSALDLWLGAYGAVAGDLALACLARGGVWLAGGTAAKLLNELRGPSFQEAFVAKGRLRPVLDPVPIRALLDPEAGSFSAACRARMLLA
ncbi:glucokinase [Cyanobium sp. FGCU-6]|jgi:glucokinase|nr:glucokinase [Cyanobium sp. FGCU6]